MKFVGVWLIIAGLVGVALSSVWFCVRVGTGSANENHTIRRRYVLVALGMLVMLIVGAGIHMLAR